MTDIIASSVTIVAAVTDPIQSAALNIWTSSVAMAPVLKWVLSLFIKKLPDKIQPLVGPTIGMVGWVIYGLATGHPISDVLLTGMITGFGAVASHEVWKGTIKGK
jgi:hypothetical protein